MTDPAAIRACVDRYRDTFTAGDREGWLDTFAPTAWTEDPVGSPRRTSREEIGAFWDSAYAQADSFELREVGLIICGREAAFVIDLRATAGGATSHTLVTDCMTFDDEGKLTSVRAFINPDDMRPID